MKVRPGVEIASLTDVGCQRENNEDNYGYWEADNDAEFKRLGRLISVADGMGGSEGGQFASQIAIESVQKIYSNTEGGPQECLLAAFRVAHEQVLHKAHETPALHGMGTTLTAFAVVEDHLYYAHVGDSRLYMLRAGKLRLLTHDHSLVARLVASGVVRAEDAETHPQKHVLTAAIGATDNIQPDFPEQPLLLEESDTLLVCTDGLWGQVKDAEIAQILGAMSPQLACSALVKLAKDRGGPDNITVQVLRVA
jgi:protein phosphatase